MTNVTMIGDAQAVTTAVVPVRRATVWWKLALEGILPWYLIQQEHVSFPGSSADVATQLHRLGYKHTVTGDDVVVVGMGRFGEVHRAADLIARELDGEVRFGV